MPPPRKPELMAPAGHWPQLHAAIEAGADAVYFGLHHFTARAKVGFSLEELPEALRTLHRRGVRGFVTFNTLVFDHEWSEAARAIEAIAQAGADALIVQDLGILTLARQIAPDLELHASTQMSVADARGAIFAHSLGASRVNLARELSLAEIRAIAKEVPVELEVFVHGALCVAFSGQCFSSEAWGGRSANRGQCAQACRLPYDLLVDGVETPLGDARYLLSPGDLYAIHQIPELVEIGVASLKIEGRYKDPEYVFSATRAYRQAIDDACAARPLSITPAQELELEQIYSRGLGAYFMSGTDHQAVVKGRAPRHRGVLLGRVEKVHPPAVVVSTNDAHQISPLKPGDGIVFDAADWRDPAEPEEGGRIYQIFPSPQNHLALHFANNAIEFSRIRPGDLLWRTHDPALEKQIQASLNTPNPLHKQPLAVQVTAQPGHPLQSTWTLENKPEISVTISSPDPLPPAQNRSLDLTQLTAQFDRLGNTPYSLADLQLQSEAPVFVPTSVLNNIRRDAVDALQRLQEQPPKTKINPIPTRHQTQHEPQSNPPQLHLLVRTPEQLDAALTQSPASITLDYLDLYGLKPSVEQVRNAGIAVRVATPRVLKPGEEKIVDFLLRLEAPLLVRPAGLLHHLSQLPAAPTLTGDFSLNAANPSTAEILLNLNLERLTPTHDLNAAQITAIALAAGPHRIEAVAYHHLPVFHTEHCVFARFLSTGTSFKDCGRPCERHVVALADRNGRRHPLHADIGCRNTVFGAEAQQASAHIDAWRSAGVHHFRLEFAHESAEEVEQVAAAFHDYLANKTTAAQLQTRLRQSAPEGITEGSLFVPENYDAFPILQ